MTPEERETAIMNIEVPETPYKKKYSIEHMWNTHKRHCVKNWLKYVSRNSFHKRYWRVRDGYMTVKEMIETASYNTKKDASSLYSRCEYYNIPYNTTYEWIKNKKLTFLDCLYKRWITPDPEEMEMCK